MPEIKTADQIERSKYLRCLIIGAPGTGKTELAATFPKPFFCDCDNGMRTLATPGFKRRHPDVDLSSVKFATISEVVDETGLFIKANAIFDALKAMNDAIEDDSIETIILDSLTSFSSFAMNLGLELNKTSGKSKSLTNARDGKGFLSTTEADIGSHGNAVTQVFDKLISERVEKHVVILAHERQMWDKKGELLLKREPLIIGSGLRGNIGRWFDDVWFLDVVGSGKDADRKLMPESAYNRSTAKSRSGLEEEIENPTYDKIMAALG